MSEVKIQKIEKEDIRAPHLAVGTSAIIFERHERYVRDPDAENAGSLVPEDAAAALTRDREFFREVFEQDTDHDETMVLFISSDTQHAGKGYRSMETALLAQSAAIQVLEELGLDPNERIINLNSDFSTHGFAPSDQTAAIPVRPDKRLREPQIFDTPEYVQHLLDTYGAEEGSSNRLSTEAWAAHEMDAEQALREELGAEGIRDIIDRTKKSLALMERYARVFHAKNKNAKLIIWVDSHYDTISPLIKDATAVGLDVHIPVNYGAGVVIELDPGQDPTIVAQGQRVELHLGSAAAKSTSRF